MAQLKRDAAINSGGDLGGSERRTKAIADDSPASADAAAAPVSAYEGRLSSRAEDLPVDSRAVIMSSRELHDKVRRYLLERYEALAREYGALPNQGREADGYDYTPEALALFPRYNVVDAVRVEIERLDPEHLPGEPELVAVLQAAADATEYPFMRPQHGRIEKAAMDDERRRIRRFVADAQAAAVRQAPLPYRRVLSKTEADGVVQLLEARWGIVNKRWHPMITSDVPEGVLVSSGDRFWDDTVQAEVRRVLLDQGRRRIFELKEYGPEYLVDLDLFAPTYTGAEGIWTDQSADWIVYASHEDTTAFGGDIWAALPAEWFGHDR